MADKICRTFGWRRALSVINMGFLSFQDFTMSSAIENHTTHEDLGPEATKQDKIDLDTLRDQLKWWCLRFLAWATHQKRETDGLRYPPRNNTGRNYNKDIEAGGRGRAKQKLFPASTPTPEFGCLGQTTVVQNTREWPS